MDPPDRRALAIAAILLLWTSSALAGVGGPATGADGSSTVHDQGRGADPVLTLISIGYPKECDPYDYSDVLVLINNNSAMSKQVGEYFAGARDVPGINVAYLDVPAREVISKAQFDDLASQVKDYLLSNGLAPRINYIVTTKGFPLKVYNSSLYYEACVDEELALVIGSYEAEIGNFYYVASPYAGERTYFSRSEQGIYLVNRLTGYDWNDVKGLIDRANDTYGNRGLFVLDVDSSKGYSTSGYGVGNLWLRNARDILVERGEDVLFDETRWYVTYQENVMGYSSWGSNDANDTDNAKPHNTWVNGSIAETFVSTGGRTFTWPPSYGQSMIADLIRENVTGVKGYVYEPFLSAIAHPDILFERYTAGFNLAESYRMASAMLGWMGVVVGDPKNSPYRDVPDLAIDDSMLLLSNTTPATGAGLTLRVGVRNLGGRVDNASLSLYLDEELVLSEALTFDTFSLTTVDIDLEAPLDVGDHTLTVRLNDGPDPFFETLYDNNEASTSFTTRERAVVGLTASDSEVRTLESVRFNVQLVSVPRSLTRFYFDFGDGTPVFIAQVSETFHSFEQDGYYNVSAWVIDEEQVLSLRAYVLVRVMNRDPVSMIRVDPEEAFTGEAIIFNASGSADMDGQVVRFSWDLGDGNTSAEARVMHAYRWPGEYSIKLSVWDDDGAVDHASRVINVLNRPPVPSFELEGAEIWKGRPVTFNASSTVDPDGQIVQYEWDFGDGSTRELTRSPWVNHAFEMAGGFTVTLIVVDNYGAIVDTSGDFTVLNRLPVAGLEATPTDLLTGETVEVDGSSSFDEDGELVDLAFSVVGPDGVRTPLGDGLAGTLTFTPGDDGVYTLFLAVTDDDGAVSEARVGLVVHNRPPQVGPEEATSGLMARVVEVPTTISLAVLALDMDGSVASIAWFLDGTGDQVGEGPHATFTLDGEGRFVVLVIATDDDGAASEVWVNVTTNVPPTAEIAVTLGDEVLGNRTVHPMTMIGFDAGGSTDPGGIARYQWDFGDGFEQEGRTAMHAFRAAATYTVTLKVTDGHGTTAETSLQVTVEDEPQAQQPIISGPALAAIAGLLVILAVVAAILLRRRVGTEGDVEGEEP